MIDIALATLVINAIAVPILTMLSLWVSSTLSAKQRAIKREDNFIAGLEKRIQSLEKEVREVRVELKNRDEEYIKLFKEHTTLRARYEVIEADYEELKKKYEAVVAELGNLKNSLRDI